MTQLEAKRINNDAYLFPPLVLGSNPSGPPEFPSAVFQSADLSVFLGVIWLEKTAQGSSQRPGHPRADGSARPLHRRGIRRCENGGDEKTLRPGVLHEREVSGLFRLRSG